MRVCGLVLFALLLFPMHGGVAEDSDTGHGYAGLPVQALWGDTHLHTSWSFDAKGMGTRVGPDAAYRFARGETVKASDGQSVRLGRPLDFLVVADHAKRMAPLTDNRNTPDGVLARQRAAQIEVWRRVCDNADRYYDPGRFTTFSGYEWTPSKPRVHRVVILADEADKACRLPFYSSQESNNVEDLWVWLAEYERKTGGRAMAIPHGANQSRGTQFAVKDVTGRGYAETRSRWETLYEVTQTKGDSETHPILSPDDEFAEFYRWPVAAWLVKWEQENLPAMRSAEYARAALKSGLLLGSKLDVNPFKIGLIGSTDMHSGLATVDENNFWGNSAAQGPGPERVHASTVKATNKGGFYAGAGLAGVWATANTRDAIFAALRRREVYATTGPRILLRLFAGWNFDAVDIHRSDLAEIGYAGGVPMGGDLTTAPPGGSPVFLISTAKDPVGANLDRAQIIKGWLDASGGVHEKIYNVVISDGRKTDRHGHVNPVGNTVDLQSASYSNRIGEPEFAVIWRDPDFDPRRPAFYYLRVLEIPTPQWPAFDRRYYDLKDIPDAVPLVAQERAYSSPVWYTPSE